MRGSALWRKKWSLLAVTAICLVALLGLSTSAVSAAGPTTADMYIDVNGPTYLNIHLDNGVAGLQGWCADNAVYINVGTHYQINIYDYFGDYYGNATAIATLPYYIRHVNWNGVAYIINNRGTANVAETQQAIWFFSDNATPTLPKAQLLVAAAQANSSFVPGVGQWKPIICDAGQPFNYPPDPRIWYQLIFYVAPVPAPDIPPLPEMPTILLFGSGLVALVGGFVWYGRKSHAVAS